MLLSNVERLFGLEVEFDLVHEVSDVLHLVLDLFLHGADVVSDLVDSELVQVSELRVREDLASHRSRGYLDSFKVVVAFLELYSLQLVLVLNLVVDRGVRMLVILIVLFLVLLSCLEHTVERLGQELVKLWLRLVCNQLFNNNLTALAQVGVL